MPLRDDLLNPIPGPNPSGENLRYAPIYDQIKEARREEEEVTQGDWQRERKKADWPLVIKLAGEALGTKSKDLQLAAWLTEAALRREAIPGLRAGLELLKALIENFWDTLYPEIEEGDAELRATPVEWVGTRLEEPIKRVALTRNGLDWFRYKESRGVPSESEASASENKQQARATAISEGKLTPEEFEQAFTGTPKAFYVKLVEDFDATLASVDVLDAVCQEKFGDFAPGFGPLRSALEEVRQVGRILLQKKREVEPDEAPAAAEAEDQAAEAGWAAPEPVPERRVTPRPALAAEPAGRDDAITRVVSAAAFLRREDPAHPASYMILRGLRWGELRAGGASPDPALLEAPPTETRQQLKRLAAETQWNEVLETAESAMGLPCGRACLDLQRYADRACQELGYYAASEVVRSGLRALLRDCPALAHMTLTDDTPTANPETQVWLREVVCPGPEAQLQPAPLRMEDSEPEHAPGEAVPDPYELAMQAVRSGDPTEAIEILAREAAQERSGRARFQRKIQLAQICMASGYDTVARPILEDLAGEIERRRLEEWETPEVMAHALALLYRCVSKLDGDAEEKQKIYARICRLDPVQALSCAK